MSDNKTKKNQETWDFIAKSFDKTRRKPWKQCIDFIKTLKETDFVVDMGCGNGRHLILCAEQCKKIIGLDFSKELLLIAKNKLLKKKLINVNFLHSDVTLIPIKDDKLDAIIYIASLHNIHGRKNRIQSLKELKRILKNDGKALISVWSKWQDKYRKLFFKKWFINKDKSEFGDVNIYWRQNGLNIPRFYHLYSKREFVEDLTKAGLKIEKIESVKLSSQKYPDNYFAIVKKRQIII
jgi:ubiquinone/menaquinone biosynthesis C-methylase UbiE